MIVDRRDHLFSHCVRALIFHAPFTLQHYCVNLGSLEHFACCGGPFQTVRLVFATLYLNSRVHMLLYQALASIAAFVTPSLHFKRRFYLPSVSSMRVFLANGFDSIGGSPFLRTRRASPWPSTSPWKRSHWTSSWWLMCSYAPAHSVCR